MAEQKTITETEMKSEPNDQIGEQLRNQRKARGISLVEVSEHTKIGKKYLEALEEGRYEVMACEAYIRGFLRAYAKYLEMDDEKLIQIYKQHRKIACQIPEETPEEKLTRKNNRTVWMPLLAMLLLAGIGAGIFLLWPSAQEEKPVATETTANSVSNGSAPSASLANLTSVSNALTLTIKGKDKTWITLMADGKQEPDITINPGEERSWSAQERFVLWTGNAGGIEVYFNGALQPPLGKTGEVRKEVVFERHVPTSEPVAMPATK